ncbi:MULTISPECIES: cytochrome P450 [Rhodobacterales]|jgi:cytochrome P450|uniref:cytochrome P450 n=1 Tax=Rhodobacterales TaxID=204455 RepID=UPI00237F8F20|nr:cytochrome P450 [Phaeobacter gallaeciensis]MDE4140105.1 cytochrome P450 [Phaeobacter gallaeciensis]MDE4148285.1 cytochrome P450 [Phaeobacter gallaeciensis]MDE4152772.1 cytochrome P450 [Phaeobacter gallaeciensis]MDE4227895.1 cytochrome P450 [Phaeobacter gallaeciensis]MDE4257237.1 cytochrome P450 [Phaeobacter gallaeciensis]
MERPVYNIDPQAFWQDPYPDLARMRAEAPVAYVPQLDAVLITRRDDIFREEKRIEVFSSDQPEGLMTQLMGRNMMRKDGAAHMGERKAIFPAVSPKTVKQHWLTQFRSATARILDDLAPRGGCDLVRDFAMPVSAEALKAVTGLTRMRAEEMDAVSQGMIDGCANYAGDPEVEARCNDSTRLIDQHITEMWRSDSGADDYSLLRVQQAAGLPEDQIRANIKLAISGGQNEPRDAIAGTVWALLRHPEQLEDVRAGRASWLQAFEEYARWMSPIGMSPRRVAQPYVLHEVALKPEDRVFLMFGSGNRDEQVFARPDAFDIHQDISAAISFGAGPHFCAGAWISRALIAEAALPMLFERLPDLSLAGEARFGGWAFRGPLEMPVTWAKGERSR